MVREHKKMLTALSRLFDLSDYLASVVHLEHIPFVIFQNLNAHFVEYVPAFLKKHVYVDVRDLNRNEIHEDGNDPVCGEKAHRDIVSVKVLEKLGQFQSAELF